MARPPAPRHAPAIRAWAVALSLVGALLLPGIASGREGEAAPLTLDLLGAPLRSDGSGPGVTARVGLAAPARLRVRVTDFDGRTVRELFDGRREPGELVRTWRGRDERGDLVPPGPYRVVATATPAEGTSESVDERLEAWLTVASRPVYPPAPGSITVLVDPGHGGSLDGAVADDGTREADLNLDIGLRLARMLEGAGVNVLLTRSTDSDVNTPAIDRTLDGLVDETDELAARPDLANAARADLFIAVHNNVAVNESVGGPSTYYYDQRPFGDRSARLARVIQERMMAAFEGLAAGGWRPYDHGTLIYPYYVLRDYDPPRLLRPTQMPGVLSEGLFLSNPRELRLLKQRRVRQAMANAYYEAIAQYLARRGSHVGYTIESEPDDVPAGSPVRLRIEVRNQGTERMRGWRLSAGALAAGSTAVGRARAGTRVGQRRIPPLRPGEARRLALDITAPAEAGRWTVMIDAIDRDGRRASRAGSPMLQVPLTTTVPPQPTAVPVTTAEPSAPIVPVTTAEPGAPIAPVASKVPGAPIASASPAAAPSAALS